MMHSRYMLHREPLYSRGCPVRFMHRLFRLGDCLFKGFLKAVYENENHYQYNKKRDRLSRVLYMRSLFQVGTVRPVT